MAYYSMILLAFLLGGIVAFVLVRIIVRIVDKLESVPLKIRLVIAFVVLTAGSGLTEILVSGEGDGLLRWPSPWDSQL